MPRNRQQIPRHERESDIVVAATDVFLRQGYSGTTMGDISTAAGVARAAVYWYFPSKDDVFAAVMDRMLEREQHTLAAERKGFEPLAVLTRGLSEMRTFRRLHREMHERMAHSAAVREAHERFADWIRTMVGDVLDHSEPATGEDRQMMLDIVVSLFEGANVTEPPLRPAHEMIRYILNATGRGPDTGVSRPQQQ